ncbi:uncharacterized protein J4E88_000824 [Alternaria novae-zelandiae]|uniref:uncharacterized protein n=1 Tax=Alternaria novae-zelandiae TaxID=430562 RepID=UPI0020C46FC7|nr:uncharacterized protein J4E88_000824 [Alternaria novae-zelandiae]KAI4696647.1 hypothetical protein J4E88_000824 [Alternaria novae-zelandiae]
MANYLEYKKDTNTYITWLCGTASSIGFTPPYKSSSGSTASQSRSQKKKSEEREVSISGLVACAEAIIKKPPKQFVVPVYAAQCAARAIRQRKKSSQWHESQVDGLDGTERVAKEEGIAGHAFFTETLEQTLNILRPFIPKTRHSVSADGKTIRHDSMEDITNRFTKLEIEELADEEVESAIPVATEKTSPNPRITYVVDNSKDEGNAAMDFLMYDYTRIKELIHLTWQSYLIIRNLDLITAAATTQAAFQMLRSLVDSFTAHFPQLGSMEAICLNYLHRVKAYMRSTANKTASNTSRVYFQVPRNLADFSCLGTFADTWVVVDSFFHENDGFGRYRSMEDMVANGYFKDQKRGGPLLESLFNALEDIAIIQEVSKTDTWQDPPIMDNFTQLWRDYFRDLYAHTRGKSKKSNGKAPDLSVEIILCTDIYLDVQKIITLADSNIIPHDYRKNWSSKNYGASSDESNAGQVLNQVKEWPFTSKRVRQGLKSFLRKDSETVRIVKDWLVGDMFWTRRATIKMITTRGRFPADKEVVNGVSLGSWPRHNPFLAGMIAFVTAQAVNEVYMVLHSHVGYPVAYAHLYNYLRQAHSVSSSSLHTPVLETEWPDMESFLKVIGDKSIFGGDRPKSLQQCYLRTLLSHGIPLSAFARGNRPGKLHYNTQPKLKAVNTPIIDALFKDGTNRRDFLNIVNKDLQDLIRREALRIVGHDPEDRKAFGIHTLVGYLMIFRRTIQYEIPKLHFNHILLFKQTARISARIHEALKDDMENQEFPFLGTRGWNGDPTVPLNIMFHEKCHQELTTGIDTDATKVFSAPVHKAASILKEELEKEPNMCTKFMERLANQLHFTNPLSEAEREHHANNWAIWVNADDRVIQAALNKVLTQKGSRLLEVPPSFRELCTPASLPEGPFSSSTAEDHKRISRHAKQAGITEENNAEFERVTTLIYQAMAPTYAEKNRIPGRPVFEGKSSEERAEIIRQGLVDLKKLEKFNMIPEDCFKGMVRNIEAFLGHLERGEYEIVESRLSSA